MVDIAKIEKLMLLMAKHGVDVVQAESSGEKISLAKNAAQAHFLQGTSHYSLPASSSSFSATSALSAGIDGVESTESSSAAVSTPAPKAIPAGETITSPFVGTFYRSPGPDSPMFVEVGSVVKKGQALCIVEAMKLMNEIECEVEGEVVAILVENAKPVEFGTPLFVIAPKK